MGECTPCHPVGCCVLANILQAIYGISAGYVGGSGVTEDSLFSIFLTSTRLTPTAAHRAVKKVAPVLGGFDAANYRTERVWATAEDGTKVPISLVYRPDMVRKDGSDNLLLYA